LLAVVIKTYTSINMGNPGASDMRTQSTNMLGSWKALGDIVETVSR